ncbi:MAG: hypothetical protein FWF78_04120 [Defluviitaleaceae bacterium]|nr:hypothetical protein [Defluviitaleaceae bacterium]
MHRLRFRLARSHNNCPCCGTVVVFNGKIIKHPLFGIDIMSTNDNLIKRCSDEEMLALCGDCPLEDMIWFRKRESKYSVVQYLRCGVCKKNIMWGLYMYREPLYAIVEIMDIERLKRDFMEIAKTIYTDDGEERAVILQRQDGLFTVILEKFYRMQNYEEDYVYDGWGESTNIKSIFNSFEDAVCTVMSESPFKYNRHTVSDDKKTLFIGENAISFDDDIDSVLKFPKMWVVSLTNYYHYGQGVDMSKQPSDNVYCIDDECNILWEIGEIMVSHIGPNQNENYVGIKKVSDEILRVFSFACITYDIDINARKVTNAVFTK